MCGSSENLISDIITAAPLPPGPGESQMHAGNKAWPSRFSISEMEFPLQVCTCKEGQCLQRQFL